MTKNRCDFCSETVLTSEFDPTGSGKLVRGHLWKYLYHQNVEEALFPPELQVGQSSGDEVVTVKNGSEMGGRAKLTFALSVASPGGPEQEGYPQEGLQLCANCQKELDVLSKLHQELEGIKRRISAQVEKIAKQTDATTQIGGNGGKSKLWRKLPKMQMVFAGATMGAENILRSLTFLSDMCRGSTQPEKKQTVTSDTNAAYPEDNLHCGGTKQELPDVPDAQHFEAVGPNDPVAEFSEVSSDQVVYGFKPEVAILPDMPPADFLIQQGSNQEGAPKLVNVSVTRCPGTSSGQPKVSDVTLRTKPKRRAPKMSQCSVCQKSMAINNLASHMRIHTGQKLYKCDVCGKSFSRRPALNLHKLKVHPGTEMERSSEQEPVDTEQIWTDPLEIY